MEDRWVTGGVAGATLVGVFDGHEGAAVAEYAAATAIDAVRDGLGRGLDGETLWRSVFTRLDDPGLPPSGSTATLILARGSVLSVAWVGDSRAVLVGKTGARALTRDHRINREDELARCLEAGAELRPPYVMDPETWQGLMMTRALGDRALRRIGITPEPEIVSASLGEGDLGFLVATDGLWDVIEDAEAASVCRTHAAQDAADRLVALVARRDGTDNVTVVVARFE